jgi:hypothetical protein
MKSAQVFFRVVSVGSWARVNIGKMKIKKCSVAAAARDLFFRGSGTNV